MKQFCKYFLVWLMVVVGCGEGEPLKQYDGLAYFPLQTGFYQIYEVAETIYTEVAPPEFRMYELKTEVIDSFPNLSGGFTFVIHRSTRATENDPWEFMETWSAYVNEFQVVLQKGNISYVQLAFPLFENRAWNSNALNTLDEDLYNVQSMGSSYPLETELEFDDTLIIDQEDMLDALLKDKREEVYAPAIGLIYTKSVVLEYCDTDPCFGQQIIKSGIAYEQVLNEYGQN